MRRFKYLHTDSLWIEYDEPEDILKVRIYNDDPETLQNWFNYIVDHHEAVTSAPFYNLTQIPSLRPSEQFIRLTMDICRHYHNLHGANAIVIKERITTQPLMPVMAELSQLKRPRQRFMDSQQAFAWLKGHQKGLFGANGSLLPAPNKPRKPHQGG